MRGMHHRPHVIKSPLHDKHYGSIVLNCHRDTLELSKDRCVRLDLVKLNRDMTITHLHIWLLWNSWCDQGFSCGLCIRSQICNLTVNQGEGVAITNSPWVLPRIDQWSQCPRFGDFLHLKSEELQLKHGQAIWFQYSGQIYDYHESIEGLPLWS